MSKFIFAAIAIAASLVSVSFAGDPNFGVRGNGNYYGEATEIRPNGLRFGAAPTITSVPPQVLTGATEGAPEVVAEGDPAVNINAPEITGGLLKYPTHGLLLGDPANYPYPHGLMQAGAGPGGYYGAGGAAGCSRCANGWLGCADWKNVTWFGTWGDYYGHHHRYGWNNGGAGCSNCGN